MSIEEQPAKGEPMLSTDIAPRPLSYSLDDYHRAPSEGALHYTWQDKPHRLLYDLIAAVAYYAGKQPATSAPADVVRYSERELELIDGMIAVQLDHAQRCDAISNRVMGEKQKGWDMERVELLRRIRYFGITAHAQKGD